MKHNQVRQVVFPVITAMIWGSSFVAQSTSTEHVGAYTFNAARSFVGFLALLVVVQIFKMLRKEPPAEQTAAEKKAGRKDLILGGICCGIALALACNLQQLGMVAGASAGKTSFITTLYVVLVPICGLFLKKRVSPTVWISVLLAVAGLYCLCIKENFTIAPQRPAGDAVRLRLHAAYPGHRSLYPKGGRRENELHPVLDMCHPFGYTHADI